MQISVLRLEVTQRASNTVIVPRGITSHHKMLLVNTLQFFPTEGPREAHSYTLPLCLQFYNLKSFSLRKCHLHPLPENHTELTWLYLQLEVLTLPSLKSSLKKQASGWVKTISFPKKLPLHFKPWLLVEQFNTKDSKCLKLQIQSSQGYCVWLNKGKYLTSWHP